MKNNDTSRKGNGRLRNPIADKRSPFPLPTGPLPPNFPIPPSPIVVADVGGNEDPSRPRNPIV